MLKNRHIQSVAFVVNVFSANRYTYREVNLILMGDKE